MPKYEIVRPDGKFEVEAENVVEANKQVNEHIKNVEIPAQARQEYAAAPALSKARMAIGDPIRRAEDALTLGIPDWIFDKLTGSTSASEATARASARNSPATNMAMDVIGTAMQPSAVPYAIERFGGGPAARVITGLLGGGLEGGATEGVKAATHGEDVGPAVGTGVAGGVFGQTMGMLANALTKKVAEALPKSAVATAYSNAPPPNVQKMGPASPTPAATVNKIIANAQSKGRLPDTSVQEELQKGFEALSRNPTTATRFNPDQIAQVNKIVGGDPATRVYQGIGDVLGSKFATGGAGLGAGFGTGNPLLGMLAAGGTAAAGKAAHAISAQGTAEAAADLQKMMQGAMPNRGPLSTAAQATIGRGVRSIWDDYYGY